MERADHTSPQCGQEGQQRSTGRELRLIEAIEQGVQAARLAALAGAISALALALYGRGRSWRGSLSNKTAAAILGPGDGGFKPVRAMAIETEGGPRALRVPVSEAIWGWGEGYEKQIGDRAANKLFGTLSKENCARLRHPAGARNHGGRVARKYIMVAVGR
jgi:hypothetical protein